MYSHSSVRAHEVVVVASAVGIRYIGMQDRIETV